MSSEPHSTVIVTPVYEDAEASSRLFKELAGEFGNQIYVIAIDDGSVRQPLNVSCISQAGLSGVLIKLKRNVGHQRAIAIGINYVADHFPNSNVVVMDSDGEDMPQTIRPLLQLLEAPEVDVVVAQRKSRVETLRFRIFYFVYKWLFNTLTGQKISFGNFMALKPVAVKRLAFMQELWTHVAGCVLISKLRIVTCSLDRGARYAGKSKMNFVSLALHGFKGLMIFAEDVLVRVGIACSIVAALAVVGSFVALVLKVLGFATPGWFSVVVGILLLVFLQTGALTLVMLMLTGVIRSSLGIKVPHQDFIESIAHAQTQDQH